MVTIIKREMYNSLNLSEVRHEQRRVAALLNSTGQLDLGQFKSRNQNALDQLFRNRYHQKFVAEGLDATFSRQERRGDNDKNEQPQKQKRTLQEKAYEHFEKLNFPNRQSKNERTKGKFPIVRPLGDQLQEQDSLRDALKISSRDGARNVPYRLPRKTEITRNLEVAIARSRRNKQNIEGRNLKPLEIPTGLSRGRDSPVVRLKLKHDDKGKGMDLGVRLSEEEAARTRPLVISPLKTPVPDRLKSGGSGRSSGQSTVFAVSPLPPPSPSRVSSGIGTYRTENEEEEQTEPIKGEDDLHRENTQDTLWFQRHGYTKSAWLRKRMRDEAAKRRKDASVGTDDHQDASGEKALPGLRKPKRVQSDVYAHTNMDAYRQAYIKALAVARCRALPKEPWLLGTRTSRAFTFSYFTHVPTCSCGQCPQKAREAKKKNEMKMIFGDVKMMDYYTPPKVVKSKRRFGKKAREAHATVMNSLKEENENDSTGRVKLPPINGDDGDGDDEKDDEDDDEYDDDGKNEDGNHDNNETAVQGDNASIHDSIQSDDSNTLVSMATKRVSFKKPEVETSGYDSDSSVEM